MNDHIKIPCTPDEKYYIITIGKASDWLEQVQLPKGFEGVSVSVDLTHDAQALCGLFCEVDYRQAPVYDDDGQIIAFTEKKMIPGHLNYSGCTEIASWAKSTWELIESKKNIIVLTDLDETSVFCVNCLHQLQRDSKQSDQSLVTLAPYHSNSGRELQKFDYRNFFETKILSGSEEDQEVDLILLGGPALLVPFEKTLTPSDFDIDMLASCLCFLEKGVYPRKLSSGIPFHLPRMYVKFNDNDCLSEGEYIYGFFDMFGCFDTFPCTMGIRGEVEGFWFDPFRIPGYPESMRSADICYNNELQNESNVYTIDAYEAAPEYLRCYMGKRAEALIQTGKKYINLAELQVSGVYHLLEVQKKQKALEKALDETTNLMGFIAHSTRGDLISLETSLKHGDDVQATQTIVTTIKKEMELFSFLSSNPDEIIDQMKHDLTGKVSLTELINHVVSTTTLMMLSPESRGRRLINHRYWAIAKDQSLVPTGMSRKEFLESSKLINLQKSLFIDFLKIMNDPESVDKWMKKHFGTININIDESVHIEMSQNGMRSTVLSAILSELFVNAFKYGASGYSEIIALNCISSADSYIFSCTNPSAKMEQLRGKGSHKGVESMNLLLSKLKLPALKIDSKAAGRYSVSVKMSKQLLGG